MGFQEKKIPLYPLGLTSGSKFSAIEKKFFIETALLAIEHGSVNPICDLLAFLTGLPHEEVKHALERADGPYIEPFLRIADLDDEMGTLLRCAVQTIRDSIPEFAKGDTPHFKTRLLERIFRHDKLTSLKSRTFEDFKLQINAHS